VVVYLGFKRRFRMNCKFFLGGHDGEMNRIAEVLREVGAPFADGNLGWGAKASQYGEAIVEATSAGFVPVLVELELDTTVPEGTVVVDHHGSRAGEPAAILQVLALLEREPSRFDLLVGANDAGYIPALLALGATTAEVTQVRAADRAAQGITSAHEAEAERAILARETTGRLTTVRMAHSKCATVTDRLHPAAGGAGYDQLLVLSQDGEVNFFGDGALCAALKEKFEGSWAGGAGLGKAGESAYWGGYPSHGEVAEFIRAALAS
jgi:hypothetical protein